jgi:hypothetical protein
MSGKSPEARRRGQTLALLLLPVLVLVGPVSCSTSAVFPGDESGALLNEVRLTTLGVYNTLVLSMDAHWVLARADWSQAGVTTATPTLALPPAGQATLIPFPVYGLRPGFWTISLSAVGSGTDQILAATCDVWIYGSKTTVTRFVEGSDTCTPNFAGVILHPGAP